MLAFFIKILRLVKPYKKRFFLGILCGVLSGLFAPALPVAAKFVIEVVFVAEGSQLTASSEAQSPEAAAAREELAAQQFKAKIDKLKKQLEKAPEFIRKRVIALLDRIPPVDIASSKFLTTLVISSIPLVMIVRGLLGYLNVYLLAWVGIRVVNDLRVRLFQHLIGLSMSFFNRSSTGELMDRINQTVVIQNTIVSSVSVIVREPITVASLVTMLLLQQTKLTMATLLVLPAFLLPVFIFGRKLRKCTNALQTQLSSFSIMMHEAFTGYRVIKAYNLEKHVVEQFRTAIEKLTSFYMRMVRATEIPGPLIEFLAAVGIAIFFIYLAVLSKAQVTTGDLVAFVASIFLMYQPIKSLVRLHSQLELARAVNQRVFELLALQSEVQDPPHPLPLRAAHAEIQYAQVDFSYGDRQVLHDIELTIRPGQLVALVGSSGAGKTTLSNLLLRFYDPQRGQIQIGGVNIRQVTLRDLRSQVAVVTQETILFNDTIRQNIAFGREGATDVEIIEAAKHAYAHEFIMEKSDGYATVVGEKGAVLSGGQRQRIAIARAILKNAPILVLDEATNALDTESERIVQRAIEELMKGRTTICIAHRLSTIYNADLIVVMDQGRIVETGKHKDLIGRGGVYKKLHDLQFQTE